MDRGAALDLSGPAGIVFAGRMAERTKATVLKTVGGASLSWVRIPLLPLESACDSKAKVRILGM
jgi:hypothetical protein